MVATFGADEVQDDVVTVEEFVHGIDDTLRIFALMIEPEPFPPPLYQAPFLDPTHPDTGLASTLADNPQHTVFTQAGSGAPPAQETYTLNDFILYSGSGYTKGTVTETGNPPPQPGIVSPIMNRVWEMKDDTLDIMDLD